MAGRTRSPHGPRPAAASDSDVRRHISAEAARIMVEEDVHDYQTAKRKAIHRLNLPWDKNLPGNDEIEAARAEYLRLFRGQRLGADTRRLRRLALEAMRFLESFEPRLVGEVLSGHVTPASSIQLHLTADSPETLRLWLEEHTIPFEQSDRRLRFGGDRQKIVPLFRFTADGVRVELCVFGREAARETPLSPVDGQPMKRANRRELERLLTETD